LLIDNNVDILWHGHDHFYAKQDTDGVIYQMVQQPARTRWDSFPNQAAKYGYKSGIFIGSRGHVRVTMDDTSATVEYVRAFFPSETSAVRHNRDVAHSYTIVKKGSAVCSPRSIVGLSRLSVSPNPFRSAALIRLDRGVAGTPDHSSVRIFDSSGRLIRTLPVPSPLIRDPLLTWDGTTDSGGKCPPGIYFIQDDEDTGLRSRALLVR
jgi:hypothetical protein